MPEQSNPDYRCTKCKGEGVATYVEQCRSCAGSGRNVGKFVHDMTTKPYNCKFCGPTTVQHDCEPDAVPNAEGGFRINA